MHIQPILDIAEICFQNNVSHVVICPGSRSAPITLSFAAHQNIETKIINDERSAGFFALGMALKLKNPVVLVCTSGSAVLNLSPAISEAYYQQVPLLILTADRPPELIDQQDGQTIRQFNIYQNYIKSSYQTSADLHIESNSKLFYNTFNKALSDLFTKPLGPIHVNIPIREPFYPTNKIQFSKDIHAKLKKKNLFVNLDFSSIISEINHSTNILFIAGQLNYDSNLMSCINKIIKSKHYTVITDISSNLSSIDQTINSEDFIFPLKHENLIPDVVITFGNSILSKKLKTYFRTVKIKHWHIAETQPAPDFFFQLNGSFSINPTLFFENILEKIKIGNDVFFNDWQSVNQHKNTLLFTELQKEKQLTEQAVIFNIFNEINDSTVIHLSNSMTVRWANMFGKIHRKNVEIYSNRGVSGIDGCTSTALGYANYSNKQNILITGDIAFFYDRNAFWNNYIVKNFKVILLNNNEGSIFRLIEGPNNLSEYLNYFTSSQKNTAIQLCNEYDLSYFYAETLEEFTKNLHEFINCEKSCVFELKSNSQENSFLMNKLKKLLN